LREHVVADGDDLHGRLAVGTQQASQYLEKATPISLADSLEHFD